MADGPMADVNREDPEPGSFKKGVMDLEAADDRRSAERLAHAFAAAWDVAWDAGIEAARSDSYDMSPLNQRDKARREYLEEWAGGSPPT